MKKVVIKYGLIGGIIISIFMCTTMPFMDENTDMGNAQLIGYATMIISLSTIFIGIKSYRDNHLNGIISFGKAFLVGLYIALIASTMYVLCWMIISDLFIPDFMQNYITATVDSMKEQGSSQAEIDAELASMNEMMEMYKNPFFKASITYLEILPVGLLVSLISAAILKKKA